MNCLSVVQYAVEVLKVKHILITGHYDCGGVRAAWQGRDLGLIDNWLRHIRDVMREHGDQLKPLDDQAAVDRLCELNVQAQVTNLCDTTILRQAWAAGQSIAVHGFIYSVKNGLLRDLGIHRSGPH